MNTLVNIDNFSVKRGDFEINNINMKIKSNEIFAILGKTGAGKSILLDAVAGFYKGNKGSIYIDNKNIYNVAIEKRNIGYLCQEYCLFPNMTVYSNIAYGLKMKKINNKEIDKIVLNIAELLAINNILNQYPDTLSGGERQRTSLARALVLSPKLLLLDEPFSALDPSTKEVLYNVIKRIKEIYKCTIIFVTHDFNEAVLLADRVSIIIDGRLKDIINSKELFNYKGNNEVRSFLGLS